MKKVKIVVAFIFVLTVGANAQLSMFKNGHWSVTGGIGFNRLDADLKPSTAQAISSFFTSPNALVEGEFSFNHIFSAGLGFNLDYINQEDENEYTWMNTQNLYPYISVDLLSAINGYKHDKWSINAMLGIGMGAVLETFYVNTSVYDRTNLPDVLNPLYISEDARATKIRDYDVTYSTVLAGVNFEYNLAKNRALGLRMMLNKTNSDKLETMPRSSKNDYIESISFTYKYKILDKNGNHASEVADFVSSDNGCCNDLDAYNKQMMLLQNKLEGLEKDKVKQDQRIKELENRPVSSGNYIDTDNDGVPDIVDKCPEEKGSSKNNGCINLEDLKLEGVNFKLNSSELLSSAHPILDKVVEVLKARPDYQIEIAGHTSSDGEEEYNLWLSQRRAESTLKYLVGKGINAYRLTAKGYGELVPEYSNATEQSRQKNRRVVFVVK